MPIKLKVDPSLPPPEGMSEETAAPVKIKLEIRKTLDGKIMILDHLHIDIVIDTATNNIITFPKETLTDEVYSTQDEYFKYLVSEGVLIPESVTAGSVYGSLQAAYPDAADENVSAAQVILLSTSKFIEKETPLFETEEFIENEIENQYVEPSEEDTTELGEVPQAPEKGSITPHRIRRYLSGYGYY